MKKFIFSLILGAMFLASGAQRLHEWRVYSFDNGGQSGKFDKLMTEIILPAYKEMGIKVACYGELSKNQPAVYYFLYEYPSFEAFVYSQKKLEVNGAYVAAMKEDAAAKRPLFTRYDSYLCLPFEGWAQVTPDAGKKVIEWRKYDAANMEANNRKVDMFNAGEIAIFIECGLSPMSFGQAIAGKDMPALIYTVQFDDMEQRDANWAKFSASAGWKAMSGDPKWSNTVSNIVRVFLTPLAY